MKARVLAAVCVLMMAMPVGGMGDTWRYGGSQADALNQIVAAPGGYFAVGTTRSSDGNLSIRTRTSETGWAMFIGEDGAPLWSLCTGRDGMVAMRAPVALEDGFSLLLTGEDSGDGEWIVTDGRGKIVTRMFVPEPGELIPDGDGLEIAAMTPVATHKGAQLAMMLAGSDGVMTPVLLDAQGGAVTADAFEAGRGGVVAANAGGEYAYVSVLDGQLAIARLSGGLTGAQSIALGGPVTAIADALMQEDGSVTAAVALAQGGALIRVSVSGDVLFACAMDKTPAHICQTGTGFAVYAKEGVIAFYDEDGALLDEQNGHPAGALDIVGTPKGAALLLHEGAERDREAVVYDVLQRDSAWNAIKPTPSPEPKSVRKTQMEAGGHVQCESVSGGVRVTCVDASGRLMFKTKIPIHTAADALVWQCALPLDDGGVALGGCYVYGTGENARCTGALALLDGAGVLRRIVELDQAGSVVAIAPDAGGMLTLSIATDQAVGAQVDGQMTIAP